jgi:hypothetical protein
LRRASERWGRGYLDGTVRFLGGLFFRHSRRMTVFMSSKQIASMEDFAAIWVDSASVSIVSLVYTSVSKQNSIRDTIAGREEEERGGSVRFN